MYDSVVKKIDEVFRSDIYCIITNKHNHEVLIMIYIDYELQVIHRFISGSSDLKITKLYLLTGLYRIFRGENLYVQGD